MMVRDGLIQPEPNSKARIPGKFKSRWDDTVQGEYSRDRVKTEEALNEELISDICPIDGIELEEENGDAERNNAYKQIGQIKESYIQRELKLLGHIIRTDKDNPLRQVTSRPGTARSIHPGRRRVGNPRRD